MPHGGFVMFSVSLPQRKPRNAGYLASLHLASAPGINQSSLKLIINYSCFTVTPGESGKDQRRIQTAQPQLLSIFFQLLLRLGVTVVALCHYGCFSRGRSFTCGVRQPHLAASCCQRLVPTLCLYVSEDGLQSSSSANPV